jgi:hypothetical protein
MRMQASDIPNIMVPQEDGAIQEALADLDTKLAVHAAAVRDTEARLREIAEKADIAAPRMAQVAPQEEIPPQTSVTRVPLQRLKDAPARTPAESAKPAEPPIEKTAPCEPEPGSAAQSHEEALLASLDEETRQSIRMMRRLNPNGSMQALLKQIEKLKVAPGPAAKPAAKSWFRRR